MTEHTEKKETAPARIPVRLLYQYGNCNAGEVAGYQPKIAAQLIKEGIAVAYDPSAPAAEEELPKKGKGKK